MKQPDSATEENWGDNTCCDGMKIETSKVDDSNIPGFPAFPYVLDKKKTHFGPLAGLL